MLSFDGPPGHIQLPDGIHWPNLNSSTLFVRSIYSPVFNDVLGGLDSARLDALHNQSKSATGPYKKKFIVCGNPGIGKSSFGLFALFSSIRRGSTVVYCAGKLGTGYVFKDKQVYEFVWQGSGRDGTPIRFSAVDVRRLTSDPSTVFICDGVMPPVVKATTLLITSPLKVVWHEFLKSGDCRMLHFPMFSEDEILQCRTLCFPFLDELGVLDRFSRWGGVPRYVLGKLDDSDQKILEDAVPSITLDKLREYVASGRVTGDDDFSHRLLHLKIRGEVEEGLSSSKANYYTVVRGELASAYVANLVHAHLENVGQENLRAFIWDSSGISSLAVLTGQLFEAEALKRLAAGGDFVVRNLSTDSVDVFELPATSTRSFSSLEELSRNHGNDNKLIHVPASKSFCAIDAVLPGSVPANVTLNTQHTICLEGKKRPGLVAIAQSLGFGKREPIPFYWVVPDGISSTFRAKSFVGPDRTVVKDDPFAKRVVQYVLKIDKGANTANWGGVENNVATSGTSSGRKGGQKVEWRNNLRSESQVAQSNTSAGAPAAQFMGGVVGWSSVTLLASGGRALQSIMRRLP